ncbi:MAG: hypothetical protein ACXABK_06955 [Candidatus Heimdallarchaeaceae archaeon]|jgi:hypothetical protein
MSENNLDFGSIENLNNSIGEMIEVNVETPEGNIKQPEPAPAAANEANETGGNTPQASEPPSNEGQIEIPDGNSSNDTEGSPQGENPTRPAQNADSPSDSKITAFARALSEQGVLSTIPEDFKGDIESLIGLVGSEIKNNVEAYKRTLPPVIADLINNYEENVPLDQLIGTKSQQMRYSSITEEALGENSNLQKALVTEDLRNRGFSDEKIQARLQLFEDNEVLATEAKDARENLIKLEQYREQQIAEQAKQKAIQEQQQNEQTLASIKDQVEGLTEIIPGMELNENSKKKLYESITSVVSNDEHGRPMNNVMVTRAKDPMKFEMTLHYLHSLGVFNGDFSKIINTQKTNATQALKQTLQSNTSTLSSGGSGLGGGSSIMDGLKVFKD